MELTLPRWLVNQVLRTSQAVGGLEWGVRRLSPFLWDAHTLHDRIPHGERFLPLRWISKGPIDRHRVLIYLRGRTGLPDALHVDFAARLAQETGARIMMPEPEASEAPDILPLYTSLLERGYVPERISLLAEGAAARGALAAMVQAKHHEIPLPGAFVSLSGHWPIDADEVAQLPASLFLCSNSEAQRDGNAALADALGLTGVDVRLEIWQGQLAGWPILAVVLKDGRRAISRIAQFLTTQHAAQGPNIRANSA